ncbi:MAG TPA: hypothetical protein VGO47_14755 [Chlamydiales bacterium]|jgi:hypothetical protein|nr:hypothetical protein [Chlamydiales bacterium]
MILGTKVDYVSAAQKYAAEIQPVDAQTDFLSTFLQSVGIGVNDKTLPGFQTTQGETKQIPKPLPPIRSYADFQTLVPKVEGLPESDKSLRTYSPKPLPVRQKPPRWQFWKQPEPSPYTPANKGFSEVWKQPEPMPVERIPVKGVMMVNDKMEHATALNNPAESALQTVQWGNPLQANYGQTIAQASGHDDARMVLKMAQESPGAGVNPQQGTIDQPQPEPPISEKKTLNPISRYQRLQTY